MFNKIIRRINTTIWELSTTLDYYIEHFTFKPLIILFTQPLIIGGSDVYKYKKVNSFPPSDESITGIVEKNGNLIMTWDEWAGECYNNYKTPIYG